MLVKDRILLERKKLDMSCADLGKLVNLSKGTINRYENGTIRQIPKSTLHKLSEAFNISFEEFIGDDPAYYDLLDKPVKRKTTRKKTADEQQLLEWYRSLSPSAKDYFQKIRLIKPTI